MPSYRHAVPQIFPLSLIFKAYWVLVSHLEFLLQSQFIHYLTLSPLYRRRLSLGMRQYWYLTTLPHEIRLLCRLEYLLNAQCTHRCTIYPRYMRRLRRYRQASVQTFLRQISSIQELYTSHISPRHTLCLTPRYSPSFSVVSPPPDFSL